MSYPEYYKILGVEPSASMKDIKQAYHALAKKLHPDLNENDKKSEEKLKKVNEAYAVLKDMAKRAEYDYFGKQALEAEKMSRNEQSEYTDNSQPQNNAAETFETPSERGFWFYVYFTVNKIILLAIMFAYMWLFYINTDKNEPYNVFKTLNNTADYLIEKIPEKSQFVIKKIKETYSESEISKKIENGWEVLEKEIQNSREK
ncbi:MAG: J domain-containing protein [Alphaproteobacteria bacterium]|nr:J domain-containing protein [Alphaproteobacteria bacterium]